MPEHCTRFKGATMDKDISGSLVFDIESDGLLDEVTKIWLIAAINVKTQESVVFSDYSDKCRPLLEFFAYAEQFKQLINHNLIGFDLAVLKKLHGWKPLPEQKLVDTLLISQALNFKRFNRRHGVQAWAESYGERKVEIERWDAWDEALIERGVQDVKLNLRIYQDLSKEVQTIAARHPAIKHSMAALHSTASFVAEAHRVGWLIDKPALEQRLADMRNLMQRMENKVAPHLLGIYKPKFTIPHWDRDVALEKTSSGQYVKYKPWGEIRLPKYTKDGRYQVHTAMALGVEPENAKSKNPIILPKCEFTPLEFIPPKMSSNDDQKRLLRRIGWVPIDFNRKKQNNRWVNTSAKLCEPSLRACGKLGVCIHVYNVTSSRYSILQGWLDALDENNYIHGDASIVGTPTFRLRHKLVANIVGLDSPWGRCIRRLFICKPGEVIVGGDSAGNQARALCHYIDDDQFTHDNLAGDLHSKNAENLTTERATVARPVAKRWYYAFLFGAGGNKLSRYVLGYNDYEFGMMLKEIFLAANPKLKALVEKLEKVYETNLRISNGEKGGIPALDGRLVYLDSTHKALNYLLQSAEAITCQAALHYAVTELNNQGIWYSPRIFMHDEMQVVCHPEDVEKVKEIMIAGFREAPKLFGVNIMDGDAKAGTSWLDTH